MRTQIRTLGTGIATAVFSVSLLAAPAFAATAPQPASISSVDRPDTDRHVRFCVKMEHLLARLVEKGVITREEAARILNALGCGNATTPPATTDRPAATTASN
jgi:hypothetical protein